MKVELFHRIESLFHEARQLEPAERAGFLDGVCDGDLDLRAEVESLLTHAGHGTERLKASPSGGFHVDGAERETVDGERLVDRGPVVEGPGTRIGNYKILQKIGEGGFGCVYMAEQEEPFQRKVALKIIKLGMDTKQVIARFEAERQALALMDHPSIARVLEAGATATGRPYFVMELVKGIPVTEYCNRNKLSTRARLELFMQVCYAVQHAHQKGVIHRDIKPSNVLVTLHDTRPVPKVIDFGIAKATSRRLTEKTLFTEFRQLIGTPEYMSPDQAEISGLDVDTRTDIYSLGVLLYELLTGTTPFDSETLRRAACGEVQRIIREVEPPRPSTRMETLVREGTAVPGHHGTETRSLSRLMRGDLDWIVMKAIEKDRTRRYQSASEFASDVDRYLKRQPVLAGPPSVVYKVGKFVRRHRLGVTAGLLITAALVIGCSLATAGLFEARREAQRSQRMADFLQTLFISTDPEQAIARDLDVERVVETARAVFGDDHATVAATLGSRALQLQSAGDLGAAEQMYRESLRLWTEQVGEGGLNVGTTLSRLGILLHLKGDDPAAEAALREGLRILRAQTTGDSVVLCEPMTVLAGLLTNQGDYVQAEAMYREALRIRKASAPHQHMQTALVANQLANVFVLTGQDEAAAEFMPEALAAWRAALPERGSFLAMVLGQMGWWYLQREMFDEAEPLFREAFEIDRASPSPPPLSHRFLVVRGLLEVMEEREEISPQMLELAREHFRIVKEIDSGERQLGEAITILATAAWEAARVPGRDAAVYRLALAAVETALAERPEVAAYINTLGVLQFRLGRDSEALAALARSDATYSLQHEGGVPADLAFMAMAHRRLGNVAEARAYFARLQAAMENPEFASTESNQDHLAEAEDLFSRLELADDP